MTAPLRECYGCGVLKPHSEFCKEALGKDGLSRRCKACKRKKARDWYTAKGGAEKTAKAHALWQAQHGKSERTKEVKRKWRQAVKQHYRKDPARVKARRLTREAVQRGELKMPSACETCATVAVRGNVESRLHAHHDDYSKPLAVRWLCQKCHGEWHKKNKATSTGESHDG